jgi:hypothetical protein
MNTQCLTFVFCGVMALTMLSCGSKPVASPASLHLDATSPETVRESLDGMRESLGHMESYRLTKVLQDFEERILVAYGYAGAEDPLYPQALWRELAPFDGFPVTRLTEELPNASIAGPSPEESASRMRVASVAWLEGLYAPFKGYAADHGGAFPPAAPVEGARFAGDARGGRYFEVEALHPEFLSDPRVLVSPAHPQAPGLLERLDEALGDEDREFQVRTMRAVGGEVALYLGVALANAEDGEAFGRALNGEAEAVFEPLRIDDPQAGDTPLLLERPGLQLDGALPVLYADGAVKVLPLGVWPNTVEFQQALFANKPLPE